MKNLLSNQKKLYVIGLMGMLALATLITPPSVEAAQVTRLKEMMRIEGVRNNAIVGYGLVVGLAGTGDSQRSLATSQSVMNTLSQFGVHVSTRDLSSRNAAAVVITTKLPPFSSAGDNLDVNVSSMGDARSLVGGTLLMAPLKAANGELYALAQGPVSVGGYQYDLNGNLIQKNHPTVGIVPGGAIVERSVNSNLLSQSGELTLILHSPDFTTANRVKQAIAAKLPGTLVVANNAGRLKVKPPQSQPDLISFITQLENIEVIPDQIARVIINERTGTVVSGGNVRIDNITLTHGDIKVMISTQYNVSQPIQPLLVHSYTHANGERDGARGGIRTAVTPNTDIEVKERQADAVNLQNGATIADLISALQKIEVTTRDVITILQSIKAAGALRAQLIIK